MVALYIVIPCYNEEEVLYETGKQLKNKMITLMDSGVISCASRLLFVDDGSTDKTWEVIAELHRDNKIFSGLKLSCNRGHQNALLAGLMTAKDLCDITISIDADLQDDIDAIDKMLAEYCNGAQIVYGVRSSRQTDSWFKRNSAVFFYKTMEFLGGKLVFNHADFRLMSKKALQGLAEFQEVNLFLRGIVPMIGYKTAYVYYERHKRFAGNSKYPLTKMLSFAFQGITSMSVRPIRFVTILGIIIFLISICMIIYTLYGYWNRNSVPGWGSIMCSIWAIGGLLLFSLGIVGEYVGKIYLETKSRPRFVVETLLNTEEVI